MSTFPPPQVRLVRLAPPKQPAARWVALGSAVGLLLGAILPWISASSLFGSVAVNGIEGDGKITAGLGVAAGIVLLTTIGSRRRVACVAVAIMGAVAALVGWYDWTQAQDRVRVVNNESDLVHASVGIGMYLTMAAAITLIVAALNLRSAWRRHELLR
jgi:hypothetical protein